MNLIELATHAENTIAQLTARIETLAAEHAQALAGKDAQLSDTRQAYAELDAYKTAMEARVSAVLQSGDPAQYEALARDFLTPAEEKARQEKIAELQRLKAEAAALESELGL